MKKIFFGVLIGVFFLGFISAGIGIKSYQDSLVLKEGEHGCVSLGAYNPYPTGTNVIIGVSDSLKEVMASQEFDSKFLPPDTSSDNAIPMEFCFDVPHIYQRDCSVGSFICELKCTEPQKIYDGEVYLQSIPANTEMGGIGGSTTKMTISRPLKVAVSCTPYSRDYTLLYVVLAVISAIVIFLVLFTKYRKPKAERDREKLKKLRAELKKDSAKKKK